MNCNALNVHSEYFWLFLSAVGVGLTLGTLIRAYIGRMAERRTGERRAGEHRAAHKTAGYGPPRRWKVIQTSVQVSLYLSLAFGAVLGAVLFMNLTMVEWTSTHPIYFLAVAGMTGIFRLFLQYLWLPAVLAVVSMIVLMSVLSGTWNCIPQEDPLLQVRILSRKNGINSLELGVPGENDVFFEKTEGTELYYRIELLEFPPWAFYPCCRVLYRFDTVYGSTEPAVPGISPVVKGIRALWSADYTLRTVQQSGITLLQPYGIYFDADGNELEFRP